MCIAVIGGMDRIERRYIDEASRLGISLKVFKGPENRLAAKIREVDALVIFTDRVSHRARTEAMRVARARNIPVRMSHSCGVCAFRSGLECLANTPGGGPLCPIVDGVRLRQFRRFF